MAVTTRKRGLSVHRRRKTAPMRTVARPRKNSSAPRSTEKVARVRHLIATDRYESQAKLDAAVDRLIEEILS